MTIIEGIGDEVIYFVGLAFLMIILALAWSSTSVSEHALIRTAVLVIDRRRRSLINNNNNTTSNSVGVTNNNTETRNRSTNVTNSRSADRSEDTETQDARRSQQTSETRVENDPYSRVEPCETTTNNAETVNDDEQSQSIAGPTADGHIRVRLKFLNDTQKLVGARLLDQLGQFKQEHFSEELENNKTVRLIFNGQLLQRDHETLQFYGLFDNCVVHCHISSIAEAPNTPVFSPPVEMDLSRLMLPLFGLIIGLIWCCRIQYRQYFNGTSTFALLCITGLFLISVIALWLPARNANARA